MVTESILRQASTSRAPHLKRGRVRRAVRGALLRALFVLLLAIPAGRAAQADDPPIGIYIYAISRDGSPVGQQRMEFLGDGEKLRVISQMQMEVTLLGMTLFSFTQQA